MGLALDESQEGDEVQNEEGFDIVIEKALLTQFGGVSIDFRKSRFGSGGFFVQPAHSTGGSCC